MLTSGRVGYTSSLAWRSAVAIVFLAAAVPAEAGGGSWTVPAEVGGGSWTGFYAGLNAGGAWGTSDVDIGCSDGGLFPTFCEDARSTGAFPFNMSNDLDGFIGGAQAGYNFQHGKMVVGLVADFAWTSIDDTDSQTTGPTLFFTEGNVSRVSQKLDWLATVRGRLGYLVHNSFLLYATGGLAFGEVDHSYETVFSGGDYFRVSKSDTMTGWTVGGGGERSFGHWSLQAEYLYYDLGEESFNTQYVTIINCPCDPLPFRHPKFETQGHIFRVGMNFKFGGHADRPVPLK